MAVVLLEDILDLPVLRTAIVRAARHACRRPVSWASVIEMPVEDFVRPNEFVLTTGMGCGAGGERFREFVSQVMACGAAAVGLSTGRYIEEVPQETIEMAEEASFPIIELPWEVRFADITRAVSDALAAEEYRALVRSQTLQATMLERVVTGASAAEVAQVLADELGQPVRLADAAGRILGSSKQDADVVAVEEEVQGGGILSKGAPGLLRVPVQSARQTEGFILVGSPAEAEQHSLPSDTRALEHASAACAFWFLHQKALQQAQIRRQDDFVWSLAKGQIGEEDATAQGSVLGYRLDRPRVCVLGRLESAAEQERPGTDAAEESERRRLQLAIDQAAREGGHAVMVTHQNSTFVLYVESEGAKLPLVHRLLDEVDRILERGGLGGRVSWGVAPAGRDVSGFARGYTAAKEALDLGYRQWGPGHRTSSEDLRMYQVLSRVAADPVAKALIAETLGPLIEYDRRKQGQLLQTLGEFIRARGQASKTAQRLVLHRQSLLYRLSKIESLTGRNLADPDDWFQLSLAHRLLLVDPGACPPGLDGPTDREPGPSKLFDDDPDEREDDDDYC